ncbi:hypothetical protein AS189_11605 [Arthrobacter alpinus]|uniref:Uncharacterized protein n=1 Tax=Arthrobacter alpinus TaxID=656366 RepID=A0A0S2LZW7_9MICC|nr:hypothetical protein [Arthrobacter alpinus]ALO67021.1 hypothetical protein AS189_11605 [Arthrobacter alpinus]
MENNVAVGLSVTVIAIAVLAVLDAWVYLDARSQAQKNHPVSVQIGSLVIEEPRAWFTFCVVLFAFFFPLYLVARRTKA